MGWTKRDVADTIRRVAKQHREEIAQRVKTAMKVEGFTNARLARESGLAEKTISRLINAEMDPRYDTLSRVAKALKVSEKDLRGEPPAPLGLGADDYSEDPRIDQLLELVGGLDEQVRLLRAELAARDAEVMRRLDEGFGPSQASR